MATIALYAGKINNMPGLIKDVRKSVEKYNKELAGLYQKTLKVDADVCDLGEVMDSLRASSQTQEQRIEMLENFQENSEDFIQDTIRIDNNVADTVDQNKDDFYDKYDYLKPDCEKSACGSGSCCNRCNSRSWRWPNCNATSRDGKRPTWRRLDGRFIRRPLQRCRWRVIPRRI